MAIALDASASRAGAADGADGQAADERIPIALSSESPVERWFGVEILDHATGAVDLSRASEGLPLLLDHSTRDQIGVIEDVTLGRDKVIRGQMRFSKSARAQEIRQDVLDGIRRSASIGYQIRELVLEKSDKQSGIDTYRATNWALLEGSIVAVPADPSVGVGRSAQDGDALPVVVRLPEPAPQARSITVSDTPAAAPHGAAPTDERSANLAALARDFGAHDRLAEWITKGTTTEQALRELAGRERKPEPIRPLPGAEPDIPDKEKREFSLGRAVIAAVNGDWSRAGYEREVNEQAARDMGRRANGFYIPTGMLLRTSLTTGGATTGQKTVFTEPGPFVELLRNKSTILGLTPMRLVGLRGNVALPRQSGAGTAAWQAEAPGTGVTESNMTFDQVTLSPKNILGTQSYSKQLFAQNEVNVDALMKEDLSTIIALKYDLGGLHGDGTSNSITGLYSISGVGSVAMGGAITFGKLVDMEATADASNALLGNQAYITTPEIKGKAKQKQEFATSGSKAIWVNNEVNGYAAVASNQVAKNLGAGTNEHGVLFGAFNQAIVADWGAVDVTVDAITLADRGIVRITAHWLADFNVRHPEAFVKGTGLTNT